MKYRKHIKRLFTIILGAVLLTVGFTGCSRSGKEAPAASFRTLDEIKKSGKIVIGVFSDKAPFGYVDENGEYQGYDIYFAERIAKDLGVKAEYISTDPASRVEYAVTGKADLILANFTVTEERAEQVDFALPYMKVKLGVVSPDNALVTDVEQLNGKTLIVVKGTTAETYFEKNYPDVTLQKYDEYADAYNALLDGRGDAFSTDNTEVLAWAIQIPDLPSVLRLSAMRMRSHLLFRKEIPRFLTGSMMRSGHLVKNAFSMQTMKQHWLLFTGKQQIRTIWLWKAAK